MQSLCYLLLYLVNCGKVPYIESGNAKTQKETFLFIQKVKQDFNAEKLASYSTGCKQAKVINLKSFITEAFSYGYTDVPDYAKLK